MSEKICDVYVQCEQSHRKLLRWIIGIVVFATIAAYLMSFLTPISYYFFGFPLPEDWKETFLVRWDINPRANHRVSMYCSCICACILQRHVQLEKHPRILYEGSNFVLRFDDILFGLEHYNCLFHRIMLFYWRTFRWLEDSNKWHQSDVRWKWCIDQVKPASCCEEGSSLSYRNYNVNPVNADLLLATLN